MSPTTQRKIPDNFDPAELGEMPDFSDITPELIDKYVRAGRQMRSLMVQRAVSEGWRGARKRLARLVQRVSGAMRPFGSGSRERPST